MLDLNLSFSHEDMRTAVRGEVEDSGTSNSSVVNAEGRSSGNIGDDDSISGAGDLDSFHCFSFDILNVGDTRALISNSNDEDRISQSQALTRSEFGTRTLFPARHEGRFYPDHQVNSMLLLPNNNELQEIRFVNGQQIKPTVQQNQIGKKSRRGPRSRSSQYRGVTFYRRTGRWESHIWDCGKQVYLGGFDTAHAAARVYDRAAIKFRGVDADINFNISDYEDDMNQCQRRFNFCIGSVFKAMNYIDRFIYKNKCHGWSYWMMELLSLAFLSVAIKFGETCPPSLREIQEGLEYCFEANLIQKMEMKILKSLGWELNSVTPYTYVELIECELNNQFNPLVRSRLGEILLASSLDFKLLEYRPCVIGMSGLRCILQDEECLSHITSFIPTEQKQKIQSCYNMMQEILVEYQKSEANRDPSSPDTVLIKELQVAIHEEQIDLSFIDGSAMKDNMIKRKRVVDDDDCAIKYKKYVN